MVFKNPFRKKTPAERAEKLQKLRRQRISQEGEVSLIRSQKKEEGRIAAAKREQFESTGVFKAIEMFGQVGKSIEKRTRSARRGIKKASGQGRSTGFGASQENLFFADEPMAPNRRTRKKSRRQTEDDMFGGNDQGFF